MGTAKEFGEPGIEEDSAGGRDPAVPGAACPGTTMRRRNGDHGRPGSGGRPDQLEEGVTYQGTGFPGGPGPFKPAERIELAHRRLSKIIIKILNKNNDSS